MLPAKKRLWIEILLHLVFWAGVFFVLTSLNSSHIHVLVKLPRGGIIARDQIEEGPISPYVYIILVFLAILFYGNVFWVFPKVIRYKNGIARVAICAGWLTIIFGVNYILVGPLFDRANPVPELPHAIVPFNRDAEVQEDLAKPIITNDNVHHLHIDPRIENINFNISDWLHIQPVIILAFLVIEGIAIGYFFLKEWAKSELIQTQLEANQLSTEIKFLKSQINPHFLFNTLNNLFSMAQGKGNDELADGISKLSGMMRYMLYDSNEESVPLSKEITYLEECITLNKLRYADEEVIITFDQAGEFADIRIAPMLFIPFVENAFKHGVAIGQRAAIQIAIVVFSSKKLIFNCVNTDYSIIRKMEMEISGIGLENVKRRLELVYPGKHRLIINKEEGKFMVKLEIDLS
jgi:two-component system, LytTR family, sensor kinase